MNHITHHDKVLAHLFKFRYIRSDIQFGAPFEITQDGIASCIGITRGHASIVIKLMVENKEAVIGLSTIKSSNSSVKRKVYFLTEYGKNYLKDRIGYLKSAGIDVAVLEMSAFNSFDDIRRNLGPRMDMLGSMCVLRIPLMKDELSFSCPLIHYRTNGEVYVSGFAKDTILAGCSDADILRWHSMAADLCINTERDVFERLYHLGRSRRDREAIRIIKDHRYEVLDRLDPGISEVIHEIAFRNPDPELSEISARVALSDCDLERAFSLSETVYRADPGKGCSLICETMLRQDRTEDALSFAVRNGIGDDGTDMVLGMCLLASGKVSEAKMCFQKARNRMMSDGCLFRMDDLLRHEAMTEMMMGHNDKARVLIRAARCISKNSLIKRMLTGMEQIVGEYSPSEDCVLLECVDV